MKTSLEKGDSSGTFLRSGQGLLNKIFLYDYFVSFPFLVCCAELFLCIMLNFFRDLYWDCFCVLCWGVFVCCAELFLCVVLNCFCVLCWCICVSCAELFLCFMLNCFCLFCWFSTWVKLWKIRDMTRIDLAIAEYGINGTNWK